MSQLDDALATLDEMALTADRHRAWRESADRADAEVMRRHRLASDPWAFDYERWLGLTSDTDPNGSLAASMRWDGMDPAGVVEISTANRQQGSARVSDRAA